MKITVKKIRFRKIIFCIEHLLSFIIDIPFLLYNTCVTYSTYLSMFNSINIMKFDILCIFELRNILQKLEPDAIFFFSIDSKIYNVLTNLDYSLDLSEYSGVVINGTKYRLSMISYYYLKYFIPKFIKDNPECGCSQEDQLRRSCNFIIFNDIPIDSYINIIKDNVSIDVKVIDKEKYYYYIQYSDDSIEKVYYNDKVIKINCLYEKEN